MDTILFDWDGTLIDTAQWAFDAFRKTFYDLGIQIDYKLYEQIYSPNWYAMYQSLGLPRKKWQEADDIWTRHYGQEIPRIVEGGRKVLRELEARGYGMGIVTSGSSVRVRREVQALGLADTFRVVICGEDVGNKKPHPEGLEQAMRRIRKRPENCCYVGDSPEDMEMGKRANLQTIGIPGRYPGSFRLLNGCADYYFESITQLLNHFDYLSVQKL